MLGGGLGFAVAWLLVKLLHGVFDPLPESLHFPWAYLAGLLAAFLIATVAAVLAARTVATSRILEALRTV